MMLRKIITFCSLASLTVLLNGCLPYLAFKAVYNGGDIASNQQDQEAKSYDNHPNDVNLYFYTQREDVDGTYFQVDGDDVAAFAVKEGLTDMKSNYTNKASYNLVKAKPGKKRIESCVFAAKSYKDFSGTGELILRKCFYEMHVDVKAGQNYFFRVTSYEKKLIEEKDFGEILFAKFEQVSPEKGKADIEKLPLLIPRKNLGKIWTRAYIP